eukprot:TRINITY_DN17040_c0_g1_i3.p1 TRINITY_DN17040_c0_g1~~TRINITY_DN17040_c0_g1_i3.p1  ORF type:complete len:410 (+),score=113.14 TRINITY_DN17040_c0_g1_i3:345-1574(+)
MDPAIVEFASLVETRASSLDGQQACHVYVAQELIADMKDRIERNSLADALSNICQAAFADIEWDWQTNRACGNSPSTGMLLSAAKIQSALTKIAASCHTAELPDTASGSSSSLGVSGMTIQETAPEKSWTLCQSFPCWEDHQDADFISTVQMDQTGDFIAAATRLGKIAVYQKNPDQATAALQPYQGYCTFQSHTAEFDYLKSLEIEERINSVRWCPRETADSQLLLATNDKTIRLWKLKSSGSQEKNAVTNKGYLGDQPQAQGLSVKAHPRKIFSNGHIYHIHSLSLNSDGETFMTSDDLRINLWHLNNNAECFNIVDLKPVNMDDLSEVITAAEFHQSHCHIFIYGSSKGCIRMGDMRAAALCDAHSKNFHQSLDSEPTRLLSISYAVFCLKKKKKNMMHMSIRINY